MPSGVVDWKTLAEFIKNCTEVAAYLAALVFFVYRAFSGYFIVDMSVKVSSERRKRPGSADRDYLALTAALKKGERGGVVLHDAQVRVWPAVGEPHILGPKSLSPINRVNRTELKKDPPNRPRRAKIDWTSTPTDAPRLNLPPGDETQLVACFEVNTETPYVAEVVILAQRIFYGPFHIGLGKLGQWRADHVSLPLDSPKPPDRRAPDGPDTPVPS